MSSSPTPHLDESRPVGVLTYLPNASGGVVCTARRGGVPCRRPAHWMLATWEDVEDSEGDLVVARVVLCRQHLASAVDDVERLPGTDPARGFVDMVDLPRPRTPAV